MYITQLVSAADALTLPAADGDATGALVQTLMYLPVNI